MCKLYIIGISDAPLSSEQEKLITSCSLVVGAKRFMDFVSHLPVHFLEITPLEDAIKAVHKSLLDGNAAVLASGDPLFYGIGRKLLKEFPEETVYIYPALSSIQRACALFRIPWDDAKILSLHGRNSTHIPGLLLGNGKNLVLTDSNNRPDLIAGQILEYLKLIGETDLSKEIRMMVAEDIGLETEKIFSGNLTEGSKQRFSPLNILCLLVPGSPDKGLYRFGLTEDSIHHSRGLITKNEVRAATLHQLQLPDRGIFWDVGAGSGSLSIEAARSNPELIVYAIEHKTEEIQNIKKNIAKFGCYNIVPVFGRAPEALTAIGDPDRVFIGGSSGSLNDIVEQAALRLRSKGRLVINGVIDKTIQTAPGIMKAHSFTVQSSVIKVTRMEPDGKTLDFNPITIMTGTR
jgi:precorrin-6Y C5,15-methyltransferase (decarboxylating)